MDAGRIGSAAKAFGPLLLLALLVEADAPGPVVAVVVGVGLVYTALRSPAIAAGVVLLLAAVNGGWLILVAAPVVVLLAARASALADQPVGGKGQLRTVGAVLAAFLLTLPFAGLSLGDPLGGGAEPAPEPFDSDDTGRSWLQRVIDRVLGREGDPVEVRAEPVDVGVPAPPEPESSINWWLIVALALLVLAVVALLLWWWRRRRPSTPPAAGWSLARLEQIGAAVGRRRRPHEGPLTYASALSSHTGDQRLEAAGPLVSAGLYESASADDDRTRASLRGLEETPPPKPPRSRQERRSLLAVLRRHALAIVAMLALVAGIALLLVVGGSLTETSSATDPRAPISDADRVRWDRVMGAAPDEVDRWVACAVHGETTIETAALVLDGDRTSIGAIVRKGPSDATVEQWVTGGGIGSRSYRAGSADPNEIGGGWIPTSTPDDPDGGFGSVDSVLAAFAADPQSPTMLTDATGTPFTRYESLPDDPDSSWSSRPWAIAGVGGISTVWVLDIWAEDGRPTRVRWMDDSLTRRWFEWRTTATPSTDRLDAACPEDPAAAAGDWRGDTAWEPSLEAPLLIGFDERGNPFDITWWGSAPFVAVPVDAIGFDDDLVIGAALEMIEPYGLDSVTVDIPASAAILHRLVRERQFTEGFVLEFSPEPVREWELVGFTDGWEGPLAFASGALPVLGPDAEETIFGFDGSVGAIAEGVWLIGGPAFEVAVTAGYDVDGQVALVVVAPPDVPFRQLGIDQDPPAAERARETQLLACLAGTRPAGPDGVCHRDDEG